MRAMYNCPGIDRSPACGDTRRPRCLRTNLCAWCMVVAAMAAIALGSFASNAKSSDRSLKEISMSVQESSSSSKSFRFENNQDFASGRNGAFAEEAEAAAEVALQDLYEEFPIGSPVENLVRFVRDLDGRGIYCEGRKKMVIVYFVSTATSGLRIHRRFFCGG